MVEIIAAYVEGRPIPRFSSSLTKAASLKRAGGLVKCWLGNTVSSVKVWPNSTAGNSWSSAVLP